MDYSICNLEIFACCELYLYDQNYRSIWTNYDCGEVISGEGKRFMEINLIGLPVAA